MVTELTGNLFRDRHKNEAGAVKWFRKAAEQGLVSAQSYLGLLYLNGYGVPQNYVEAAKWYLKAAEQGHVGAFLSLGKIYYHGGKGVLTDKAEALQWYRKAAEQGDILGACHLAKAYMNDMAAEDAANIVKGYMWVLVARSLEDDPDLILTSPVSFLCPRRKQNLTPAQISKAHALAAEWWEKHNN